MHPVKYAMGWWGRAGRRTLGGVCGLLPFLLFLSACDSQPKIVAGVSLGDYDLQLGKQVWSENCMRCHSMGLAGAPKMGDTNTWTPRLAKGMDALSSHALKGFLGKGGNEMPARGGNPELTDDEVTAAVAYMLSESS